MNKIPTSGPEQRKWLQLVMSKLGISATELARLADLDPSTLTRFLKREQDEHNLTARTIKKIEMVAAKNSDHGHKPGSDAQISPERVDLGKFNPKATNIEIAKATKSLMSTRPRAEAYTVNSNAFQKIGIASSDILIVDPEETARADDLVYAQILSPKLHKPYNTIRLYEPPYLLSGSLEATSRTPNIVDNTNTKIIGVVIGLVRSRAKIAS